MSNGHTPGPWSFRGCEGGLAIDFNEDQEQVVDYAYEEADARLIAAAPELLAAAMKVNALSIQTDAHKELRAAIAKARGTPC